MLKRFFCPLFNFYDTILPDITVHRCAYFLNSHNTIISDSTVHQCAFF
nr:MAG TPA: hypothetical protein [Caudoviricetes sp.]